MPEAAVVPGTSTGPVLMPGGPQVPALVPGGPPGLAIEAEAERELAIG